jgi:hypothetical protein
MCRRVIPAFVWLGLLLSGYATDDANAAVRFAKDILGCEPPSVFYSNRHIPERPPCCATIPGRCEGLQVCPESGVCPDSGRACTPEPGPTRPNILLFIADDVGACHNGFDRECRSAQSGTPLPAPLTPNLDALASRATVFPIAHNTAAWCYPSLNSMLTGRFQRSFDGNRSQIGEKFATLPRQLRSLGERPEFPVDPYDADMRVGGYCTYLGGKFTGSAGQPGFDGGDRGGGQRLGRLFCSPNPDGGPPKCGSERSNTYDPLQVIHIRELFQFIDAMIHPMPEQPGTYGVKPWFIWYAPRIPHQPLRAPLEVEQYLFGSDPLHRGGLFDLGRFCSGATCARFVDAFEEINFGTVREFYASMWWMDDNMREIRKFLDRASKPHCIGRNGEGRYEVATPGACNGTWATSIAPDMARNTVIMYLADNGWHLPNSKHHFAENGYRTTMMVYDPRTLEDPPSWRASDVPPSEPYKSSAIAHSTDILPTVLGFALDSPEPVACPTSDWDGTACDGRDLRSQLITHPGGPAPSGDLRRSLCGHHTQRSTKASRQRYLLTRPDSVGRCVPSGGPACTTSAECATGWSCIGGRCLVTAPKHCGVTGQCPAGSACLAGLCRPAPVCVDDANCGDLLPGQNATCDLKGQAWCRNAPHVACGTEDDCPVCPTVNGAQVPCNRVCEPRVLKLYLSTGSSPDLVDLFTDPDEVARYTGPNDPAKALMQSMSSMLGPYGKTIRNMNCCIDDWWADGARGGSLCIGAAKCPADLTCNQ